MVLMSPQLIEEGSGFDGSHWIKSSSCDHEGGYLGHSSSDKMIPRYSRNPAVTTQHVHTFSLQSGRESQHQSTIIRISSGTSRWQEMRGSHRKENRASSNHAQQFSHSSLCILLVIHQFAIEMKNNFSGNHAITLDG